MSKIETLHLHDEPNVGGEVFMGSTVSPDALQDQASAEAGRILQGLQIEEASKTFAGANGLLQSDEMRPGVEIPQRLLITKTTNTEGPGDD